MKATSIGANRAFPGEVFDGMSYRQWLIGQALAGAMAANFESSEQVIIGPKNIAALAVEAADAVIALLDEEAVNAE